MTQNIGEVTAQESFAEAVVNDAEMSLENKVHWLKITCDDYWDRLVKTETERDEWKNRSDAQAGQIAALQMDLWEQLHKVDALERRISGTAQ